MFPIQQCRVHSLVGTPSDVRAYFSHMAQSNDMGETQSNDMSQSQSNSSPAQSNDSHAQSNGVSAQSNGMGAAPGDLNLSIFYSPHPEPSSYGHRHQHRASAGEGGLTKTEPEPEPAVLCLGHAVVPLNQYVMKWLSEGTSLRSGWFILYVQHTLSWASQDLCCNHPLALKLLLS